ncbi:MAG: helix-turn-helix transcriptional regulator [Rhizobiales bacterium]|nr:helix-turn-helix transcriptional regulator [Hyphomicrobiales bacterium]
MPVQAGFAKVAALLADPAREAMLVALADGRTLPAGELAAIAGITPQSANGHLRKLVDGGVISVWTQGRFRYFRLANEQVGTALETLAGVTGARSADSARVRPSHLVAARCCYKHLAGRLGVALADALVHRGYVCVNGNDVTLTDAGEQWMTTIAAVRSRSPHKQLRLCLDWTERRFHFSGPAANDILRYLLDNRLMLRGAERSLTVTPAGLAWFRKLGLNTADTVTSIAKADRVRR